MKTESVSEDASEEYIASQTTRRSTSTDHEADDSISGNDPSIIGTDGSRMNRLVPREAASNRILKQYCGLLADTVKNLHDSQPADRETLPGSYIGESYWTSTEKSILFLALARHEECNSKAVSDAIGTKSVPEVRRYVLALREGVEDLTEQAAQPRRRLRLVETLAADEISEDCELALDTLARRAEEKTFRQACNIERARFGEHWIFDLVRAREIEDSLAKNEARSPGESEVEDVLANAQEPPYCTSEGLLRPLSFIELSANVFMNCNADIASRYDNLPIRTNAAIGPAILRSAMDTLHEICISYTQKLVQAAHFQALTRLRVDSNSLKVAAVRSTDVWTAMDILGNEKPDRREYWIKAMRRYKIQVYSTDKRYRAGIGYKGYVTGELSAEEVDQRLREPVSVSSGTRISLHELDSDTASSRSEVPEELPLSDASDVSYEDKQDIHSETERYPAAGESDCDETSSRIEAKESGRRQHSADSFDSDLGSDELESASHSDDEQEYESTSQSDDEREYESAVHTYLSSCDRNSSHVEDNNLRSMVGLPRRDRETRKTTKPYGNPQDSMHLNAWRRFDHHLSDWEHQSTVPTEHDFLTTRRLSRKRRRSTGNGPLNNKRHAA